MGDQRTTHGACTGYDNSLTYRSWMNMKQRGKRQYRARGITVCPEWLHDYPQFLKDMGERPTQEYSIERIDNDGDYTPANCKWATHAEQMENRSNTVVLALDGVSKTMTAWAKEKGLTRPCIAQRLNLGWTVEKALNTPMLRRKNVSCSIGGCDKKHHARGFCTLHYQQDRFARKEIEAREMINRGEV